MMQILRLIFFSSKFLNKIRYLKCCFREEKGHQTDEKQYGEEAVQTEAMQSDNVGVSLKLIGSFIGNICKSCIAFETKKLKHGI